MYVRTRTLSQIEYRRTRLRVNVQRVDVKINIAKSKLTCFKPNNTFLLYVYEYVSIQIAKVNSVILISYHYIYIHILWKTLEVTKTIFHHLTLTYLQQKRSFELGRVYTPHIYKFVQECRVLLEQIERFSAVTLRIEGVTHNFKSIFAKEIWRNKYNRIDFKTSLRIDQELP